MGQDVAGNYVVVELQKGRDFVAAVGRIQRYMTWVQENLARNGRVRGIIVVQKSNAQLKFAAIASKYPIRIIEFGDFLPVRVNLRYCNP